MSKFLNSQSNLDLNDLNLLDHWKHCDELLILVTYTCVCVCVCVATSATHICWIAQAVSCLTCTEFTLRSVTGLSLNLVQSPSLLGQNNAYYFKYVNFSFLTAWLCLLQCLLSTYLPSLNYKNENNEKCEV